MKIQINITKDILKRSMMCGTNPLQKVTSNCAIALAVRDIFKFAQVSKDNIYFYKEDNDNHSNYISGCSLPESARVFIEKFDYLFNNPEKRLKLPEFSFEIEIPNAVIEQMNLSEVYKILSESETMELVAE